MTTEKKIESHPVPPVDMKRIRDQLEAARHEITTGAPLCRPTCATARWARGMGMGRRVTTDAACATRLDKIRTSERWSSDYERALVRGAEALRDKDAALARAKAACWDAHVALQKAAAAGAPDLSWSALCNRKEAALHALSVTAEFQKRGPIHD